MAKLHQQDQQNLTFDEMMRFLDGEFQRFPEHRAGNAVRYELADVLKSAFASMRNLISVLIFNSMEALYRHMASLYRLQIE
jgi:hypothetical protein